MKIYMTPHAFWHLQWTTQRTDCELSSMGILSIEKKGLTVADVVLVKQEVSVAHVDLDMDWWAEKQVELFETRGIALRATKSTGRPVATVTPLWSSCPPPHVGGYTGRFYARLDFNRDFGPRGTGCQPVLQQRFNVPCDVDVLCTDAAKARIDEMGCHRWDRDHGVLSKRLE